VDGVPWHYSCKMLLNFLLQQDKVNEFSCSTQHYHNVSCVRNVYVKNNHEIPFYPKNVGRYFE
jgi:hypothetical protein